MAKIGKVYRSKGIKSPETHGLESFHARKRIGTTQYMHVQEINAHEYKAGAFTVHISNKQHYKLYTIYLPNGEVVRKLASAPDLNECLYSMSMARAEGKITASGCNATLDLMKKGNRT